MLIIAYPLDAAFLSTPLAQLAQADPWFRYLHDLLEAVFTDPQVQLAMRHDLAPDDTQAAWNGRPSLPLVATGCLAVVRQLTKWSYRTLAREVNFNAAWRWVCQLFGQPMPNFRTIRDREALLSPATLQRIQRRVLAIGVALRFTQGQRLRVDTTVTETNSHHPWDSQLLDDAARVLSRYLKQARAWVPPHSESEQACFRDRHRQAHHLAVQISQGLRKRTREAEKTACRRYRQLLGVVTTLLTQVAQVQTRLQPDSRPAAQRLRARLAHYVPLVQRVVAQADRRVLQGQAVPASEKVVSLFEPHTAIIRRGKTAPHETEFGIKVWCSEVEGGLISDYGLWRGNPPDKDGVIPSLQRHRALFGHAPRELCGDRGMYSPENERQARRLGVRRVCLPQPGHKQPRRQRQEQQDWYRAAQRFRNGVEGRISQVRRARGLTRCLNHGWSGLERWIGWGVIANNISVIVVKLVRRRRVLSKALAAM